MKGNGKKVFLMLIIAIVVIALMILLYFKIRDSRTNVGENNNLSSSKETEENQEDNSNLLKNGISKFDLSFLKFENEEKNKIYSPLSIKYALKMLEDGTSKNSNAQIKKVLGKYELTKYNSNSNMSLANAFFVRDTFKNQVKENYVRTLKDNYNAEIIFDSFKTPDAINSWVSNKTFNLINNVIDGVDEDTDFCLINSLAIDMEWNNKFLDNPLDCTFYHEDLYLSTPEILSSNTFKDVQEKVSGMEIAASINRYDVVKEIGEENILKTVSEAYRKWAKDPNEQYEILSDEKIEDNLNKFLNGETFYDANGNETYSTKGYIEEIKSNYGKVDYNTDFSFYVDDDIKAFSKDLKEYDGTTLQYIAIMPKNEDLDDFVEDIDETKINEIISNLKEIKLENFKDGVVTRIFAFIPKFKFDYELALKDDLKKLGITDVFEEGKANLTELSEDSSSYISDAIHKANIEFTQDGIKAAAATVIDGRGGGEAFDYKYDVPVEDIDLTFDKPFMFLIR